VIVSAGLIVMLKGCVAVWAGDPESVTFNVKLDVPLAVAVPVIAQVEVFNERPPGNEPELMENVYGVVPPVAAQVAE
jgi:hypothetical protein